MYVCHVVESSLFFVRTIFFTFVHVKKPRSSRQVFFSLFSKVDIKVSRSQADRNSNIIWQDCTNGLSLLEYALSTETIWPEPSSTSLLFSAISKGSGETVRMCMLAWSFTAHICDKYLNHMK